MISSFPVRTSGVLLVGEREGRRKWVAYLWAGLASLCLHLLLPVVTPSHWLMSGEIVETGVEVYYSDEEIPAEWRYFESNPAVASHEPEETPLISDRSQRSAQPEEAPETDPLTPYQETGIEEANKVVSGDASPQQEWLEALQATAVATQSSDAGSPTTSSQETDILPVVEEGAAVTVVLSEGQESADVNPEPQVVVVGPVTEAMEPTEQTPLEPQPRRPQPRPRLTPSTLPGPVVMSRQGSHRIGEVTASTRFHEFGDYLSRLIETIGHQWHSLVDATFRSTTLTSGTVRIQFTLTRQGEVTNVRILQEVELQQAVLICQDAIQSIAPFAEWTEQMVALLGESQEITISFIYRP